MANLLKKYYVNDPTLQKSMVTTDLRIACKKLLGLTVQTHKEAVKLLSKPRYEVFESLESDELIKRGEELDKDNTSNDTFGQIEILDCPCCHNRLCPKCHCCFNRACSTGMDGCYCDKTAHLKW